MLGEVEPCQVKSDEVLIDHMIQAEGVDIHEDIFEAFVELQSFRHCLGQFQFSSGMC